MMVNKGVKLPLLISVPHGGTVIPEALKGDFLLSDEEVLLDSDTWTRELFNFRDQVEEFVETDIARIVVDLNRAVDDLPPHNPDGVVKLVSVAGKPVWKGRRGLRPRVVEEIIQKYHVGYHRRLEMAARSRKVLLGVDCHSMLGFGPEVTVAHAFNPNWKVRPMFCISNRGGLNGEYVGEKLTAPEGMLQRFKSLLEMHFRDFVGRNIDVPLVTLNDPFRGGYITKYHGSRGPIPWIQLEINRSLYLPSESPSSLQPSDLDLVRFEKIRSLLYQVFMDLLTGGSGNRPRDVVS